MTAGLWLWLAWLTCLDWLDRLPSWYALLLAAAVACAAGMILAAGCLYVQAVHARAVVHARESHAPAVTAT